MQVYPKNENNAEFGRMSRHLDSLEIGNTVHVSGPAGRLVYLGNGNFTLEDPTTNISVKKVAMIAGMYNTSKSVFLILNFRCVQY
jgi:ferredoxin-NADP reductase